MYVLKKYKTIFFFFYLITIIILTTINKPQAQIVNKILILPFVMNDEKNLFYLANNIHKTITTYFTQQKQIIIEPNLLTTLTITITKSHFYDELRKLGKKFNAHMIIFGSITKLNNSIINIDTLAITTTNNSLPLITCIQTSNIETICPCINDFTQHINYKILKKYNDNPIITTKKNKLKNKKTINKISTDNNFQPIKLADIKKTNNIEKLNPFSIKNTKNIHLNNFWRSPYIDGSITSLAAADIDNDGNKEILILLSKSLRIYRFSDKKLIFIHEFNNGPSGNYLFVDIADIIGSGTPQIFITNHQNHLISSFVLEWHKKDSKFILLANDLPYCFRIQPKPIGIGNMLIGQKIHVNEFFSGPIYEIGYKNNSFVPIHKITLPKECNIYNCVLTDLDNSGNLMIGTITNEHYLNIFTNVGEKIWTSSKSYANTDKYLEFNPTLNRNNESIWYYLPARLVLSISNNKHQEIIIVNNKDRTGGILERTRTFFQSTLHFLSWNGTTITENWHTPNINGSIIDYITTDIENYKQPVLIIGVKQHFNTGFFENNVSYLIIMTPKT